MLPIGQYPLHHVTYAATKLEVATSNRLGGDTFTCSRNVTVAVCLRNKKIVFSLQSHDCVLKYILKLFISNKLH